MLCTKRMASAYFRSTKKIWRPSMSTEAYVEFPCQFRQPISLFCAQMNHCFLALVVCIILLTFHFVPRLGRGNGFYFQFCKYLCWINVILTCVGKLSWQPALCFVFFVHMHFLLNIRENGKLVSISSHI